MRTPAPLWRSLRRSPSGIAGVTLVLLFVSLGLLGPALAPFEVDDLAGIPGQAPGTRFLLGTDALGRDILSRVLYGARISLVVAGGAVGLGTAVGLLVGLVSGYRSGRVDLLVQRLVDVVLAFPPLVLLLVAVRVAGPSAGTVVAVIGLVIAPGVARVVRGAVLVERALPYVEASRALGGSDTRIIFRHILPNIVPVVVVVATTLLAAAMLAEASLSFLGLGVPPPNPSWGADVAAARNAFPVNVPQALFPGLAMALAVLGVTLLGDWLRDLLDPRLRSRVH
ncbi:MAG: glutathione ABC transporter permease GsiD [Chloroflexi bacterium HGW-Chloroflexi-9]|nr:MAG: glutathione ABC transporter permease GsiD [Chloroflexi bacterium HGW-Chloroflexi-9]